MILLSYQEVILSITLILCSFGIPVRALRLDPEHSDLSSGHADFIKNRISASSPVVTEDDIYDALYDHMIAEELAINNSHKLEVMRQDAPGDAHWFRFDPIPRAQEPADREVAVLIHTYDGNTARKFWPFVLEGTARHLMADAPPGFKLYFAHDGLDDISCLTKNLPVSVTELKYGKKVETLPKEEDPIIPFVQGMDYGWADSLIKTLEQIPERWLFFVQEDTAFPARVDPSLLERIVDFAVFRDLRFLGLMRIPTVPWKYNLDGWRQTDMGNMTFRRIAGGKWAVNHNIALIDTKWWLERAKKARDAIDGGHQANEAYEHLVHPAKTTEEHRDRMNKIYTTHYNTPFSIDGNCDMRHWNLDKWGCREGSVPSEPSKLGLDMAVPISHHGRTDRDHWQRNYSAVGINTLERLGIPVDKKGSPGCAGFKRVIGSVCRKGK